MFKKRKRIQELEERLVKAELAASMITELLNELHYASQACNANWDYEPALDDTTLRDMVDEIKQAYGTKEVWNLAWPNMPQQMEDLRVDSNINPESIIHNHAVFDLPKGNIAAF